ncbi:MAG TPA: class IV adenylate cyclase [Candidatus Paceibacterota bacterium]|nr:class IV adenylate cyclase [Candidatus Paceibacterota bacterium]
MREIEIKLPAPNLEETISRLKELGCVLSEPITQEDINFIHKDDVKWFESNGEGWVYPRLRLQNNKSPTFTIKKPMTNEMDCLEYEMHVDNVNNLRGMMELFDYKEGVTVKKNRRTCKYGDYEITVDEVEKLGNFVEIEQVVVDGDASKIQDEMFRFAKDKLNLEKDNAVMKGYDILLHYFLNK